MIGAHNSHTIYLFSLLCSLIFNRCSHDFCSLLVFLCLNCSRDTLFGRIYERFASDVIAKGTFLECLEPYIQADCLTLIPPSVMREFVEHYQLRGMLDGVEASIVHLDIASLDIHQVCCSSYFASFVVGKCFIKFF